jgi:hypothetical protein
VFWHGQPGSAAGARLCMTSGSKMLEKASKYIIVFALLVIIAGAFIGGFSYRKKFYPCPESFTHTVILYDTIIHRIADTVPYYIVRYDSVTFRDTVFESVDTAAILKDYFAEHYYTRTFNDSLLSAEIKDVISRNSFGECKFSYRILRPQIINTTTVNNSVVYSKYILLGLDVQIKDYKFAEIEAMFAFKQGYFGLGFSQKGLSVKVGGTLFKFK